MAVFVTGPSKDSYSCAKSQCALDVCVVGNGTRRMAALGTADSPKKDENVLFSRKFQPSPQFQTPYHALLMGETEFLIANTTATLGLQQLLS